MNAIEKVLYKILKSEELIRSTGVTLQNLRRDEDIPQDLFGIQEKEDEKNIVEIVSDEIRKKFGHNILKRASSLKGSGRQRGNLFPGTH